MSALKQIIRCCRQGNSFLLIGHIDPDGDSIGSVLALGRALQLAGKEVYMASPGGVPDSLLFLRGAKEMLHCPGDLNGFVPDYIITLDTADLSRLGKWAEFLKEDIKTVNIDHHISNSKYGHVNWIKEAGAAGQLVFTLLRELGWKIDYDIAQSLYVAIVTDTGSFSYDNTTSESHEMASELLTKGVRPAKISRLLYESKPLAQIKLLGIVLQSLQVCYAGKVAYLTVTRSDLALARAADEDANGFVNYPRSIAGVEIGLLFFEKENHLTKVSLRSGGNFDVGQVAAKFAGGGHPRAAGCLINLPIKEAKRQVMQAIDDLF
jgi:phosphoesterase RecJ-like protein